MWLGEIGLVYTARQMNRIAWDRKLPFRPGPDGRKLFIKESELRVVFDSPPTPPKKQKRKGR